MLAFLLTILATITLSLLGRVIWPREVKHPQLPPLAIFGDMPHVPAELKTAGNYGTKSRASHPPLIDHSHSSHSRFTPPSSGRFGGL